MPGLEDNIDIPEPTHAGQDGAIVESESSESTPDSGTVPKRRSKRGREEALLGELKAARDQLQAVTDALLKNQAPEQPPSSTVAVSSLNRVPLFSAQPGTSSLSDHQKDANRRALLARCSEEFKRCDPLKQQPFPNPFTGSAVQDLDEFLIRFEVRANNCNWTEHDKVMGLAFYLDKGAALAYQRMIANGELATATFSDAVAKLRRLFPQAALTDEQAMGTFMAMRQRRNESVTDYSERFQTTLARAERYQGTLSPVAIFNRFCTSLRKELRDALRFLKAEAMDQHPLQGAIAEAMRIEARLIQEDATEGDEDSQDEARSRSLKRRYNDIDNESESRPQVAKRVVRAITKDDEMPQQQPTLVSPSEKPEEGLVVLRQVKTLLDTTHAIATRMQETQHRDAEERYRGDYRPPPYHPRSPPPLRPPMTCFSCGRVGHKAVDCLLRKPLRPNSNRIPDQSPRSRASHSRPYSRSTYERPGQRTDGPQTRSDVQAEPRIQRQLAEEDRQALARTMALLRAAGVVFNGNQRPAEQPTNAPRPN
jgi:hypothetical protein